MIIPEEVESPAAAPRDGDNQISSEDYSRSACVFVQLLQIHGCSLKQGDSQAHHEHPAHTHKEADQLHTYISRTCRVML